VKENILERSLNGTIHSSADIDITIFIENGLNCLYFDAKELTDLRLGNLTKLSVISILIMKNHLESLKWVLKETHCPLTEIFDSMELCHFSPDDTFEIFSKPSGLVEYAFLTKNLDLFKVVYEE